MYSSIANLKFWVMADQGITKDYYGRVSEWEDCSPTGTNCVTQSTGSNMPYLLGNTRNGMPVVGFDGVNDFLESQGLIFSGSSSFTMFAVLMFNCNGGGVIAPISHGRTSGIDYGTDPYIPFNWWYNDYLASSLWDGAGMAQNSNATRGTWYLGTSRYNKDTGFHQQWLGGNPAGSSYYSMPSLTGGCLQLGGLVSNGWWFPGQIAEVLIYDSNLSDTDRMAVEAYLKTKYALP